MSDNKIDDDGNYVHSYVPLMLNTTKWVLEPEWHHTNRQWQLQSVTYADSDGTLNTVIRHSKGKCTLFHSEGMSPFDESKLKKNLKGIRLVGYVPEETFFKDKPKST